MAKQASVKNLAKLIARLKNAGVDWDGENIADLLWLTNYIDLPVAQPPVNPKDESESETVQVEENTAPAAPLSQEPEFSLFSDATPQQTQTKKTQKQKSGIPFQTPTAPALRQTLPLGRALRPLMRRVESYTQMVLDEEATAEQTAEQKFCMTMVKPARERWLELALVIEDSPSSFLWRETIRDFRQVLERQGAFRLVTTWYLQTSPAGLPQLYAKRPLPDNMPRARDPKEIIDSSGRRLVLVMSDCISSPWRQGRIQSDYLQQWASYGPVAVVQMLPTRLWSRTGLSTGLKTGFSSRAPGLPNAQLTAALPFGLNLAETSALKLPVITLDPASMLQWARMLAGFGDSSAAGVWFDLQRLSVQAVSSRADRGVAASESEALIAQQLVDRFSQTASYTARKLASLMALIPLELSLIYIIQARLLPESSPLHIAEVFLSGLIERVKDGPSADASEVESAPVQGSLFALKRRYRFVEGVRDLLTDTGNTSSAEQVLNQLSIYIGEKLDCPIHSFIALLRLKDEELAQGGEEVVEFAYITKQSLRRLGGRYADLVDAAEAPVLVTQAAPRELLQWPSLEVLEFTKGELIRADEESEAAFPPLKTATFNIAAITLPQSGLEPFEFQTATLERRRTGLLRRQTWVVKKNRAQAARSVDPLSDDVDLEMVWIPAGKFVMGSPRNEPDRSNSEGPQHEVTVPQFLMGRYPITQAQWRVVAAMPQVNRALEAAPSSFKGDDRPVEKVSWQDAVEFCDRISAYTNRTYRLPTEAEWEYACRAGSTTPFHFGSTLTTEVANYDGDSTYADGPKGQYRQETTPVDHFNIANAFGLSDMHGNVWEWCQDHWHDNYDGAPTDGSAWLTEDPGASRVLRGGSWIIIPEYCRSASRVDNSPDSRNDFIGFRVCCSPPRSLP